LKSFIVEMSVFIEMVGSRNTRPQILRLSLTKPQHSRGQLYLSRSRIRRIAYSIRILKEVLTSIDTIR
jgi:hypothetical protein